MFPNETISTYYLVGKRTGNKGAVQAKGKLVDKVKNIRFNSPDKVFFRKRKMIGEAEDIAKRRFSPSQGKRYFQAFFVGFIFTKLFYI